MALLIGIKRCAGADALRDAAGRPGAGRAAGGAPLAGAGALPVRGAAAGVPGGGAGADARPDARRRRGASSQPRSTRFFSRRVVLRKILQERGDF